jgi:hypothetical protein
MALDPEIFREMVWAIDGYLPTPGQSEHLADKSRLKLIAGGIRAGKSKSTARDFDEDEATENGLIWIVGPDYEQCKPEFKYLSEPLKRLNWIEQISEPERGGRTMTLNNGCKVQTKSSDDTASLASFAPNAILMVEAGQQSYETYTKCLERALEHNAKVVLSGTFEGALSWYADLFSQWQGPNPEGGRSFSLPSWTNNKIFPGGRTDPKILALEAAMPEDLFMERVGAQPFRPQGLVFKSFTPGKAAADGTMQPWHVKKLDYNPDWPVEIAVDPASHTYAVEAIQWNGPKVHVIDEIYMHDTIAQDVIPIVMEKPWWSAVKTNAGVIDVAGKQHQGNKSQVEIWREMTGKSLRSKYVFIDEGIAALKLRLQQLDDEGEPLLQFDYRLNGRKGFDGRAKGIVAEMGLFKWREWSEGQNQTNKPLDANNDGCKALWYWLYDQYGPVVQRRLGHRTVKRVGWS